jgi:hypothetical protein
MKNKISPYSNDFYEYIESMDKIEGKIQLDSGQFKNLSVSERVSNLWEDKNGHSIISGSSAVLFPAIPVLFGVAAVPLVQQAFCAAAAALCVGSIAKSTISISKDAVFVAKHIANKISDKFNKDEPSVASDSSAMTPIGLLIGCKNAVIGMKDAVTSGVTSYFKPLVTGFRESNLQKDVFNGTSEAIENVMTSKLIGATGDKAGANLLRMVAGAGIAGAGLTGTGVQAAVGNLFVLLAHPTTTPVITLTVALGVTSLAMGGIAGKMSKIRSKIEKKEELSGSLVTMIMTAGAFVGGPAASLVARKVGGFTSANQFFDKLLQDSPEMSTTIKKATEFCEKAIRNGTDKKQVFDDFFKANQEMVDASMTKASKLLAESVEKAVSMIDGNATHENKIITKMSKSFVDSFKDIIKDNAEEAIKTKIEKVVLGEMEKNKSDLSGDFLMRRTGVAIGKIADVIPVIRKKILTEVRALMLDSESNQKKFVSRNGIYGLLNNSTPTRDHRKNP